MTNTLVYFTATGYWEDIEAPDPAQTSGTPDVNTFTAFVNFYPRVPPNYTLYIPQLTTSTGTFDTGIELAEIRARITNGKLVTINRSDTEGIQLLANTAPVATALTASGITTGLVWDVEFTDVVYAGKPRTLKPFGFAAPATSSTVSITSPSLQRLPYCGPGSGFVWA
jgi:hypothetical protein